MRLNHHENFKVHVFNFLKEPKNDCGSSPTVPHLPLSTLLSKGPPTATAMCRYSAFKEAQKINCNVQVLYFQKAPTSLSLV